MDDLRRPFAALDAVVVPDLWAEIERRAAALTQRPTTVVVPGSTRRVGDRQRGAWGPRFAGVPVLLVLALLATALIATLIVGAGWWLRSVDTLPTASPSSAPTASTTPTSTLPPRDANGNVLPPIGRDLRLSLGFGQGVGKSPTPGLINVHEVDVGDLNASLDPGTGWVSIDVAWWTTWSWCDEVDHVDVERDDVAKTLHITVFEGARGVWPPSPTSRAWSDCQNAVPGSTGIELVLTAGDWTITAEGYDVPVGLIVPEGLNPAPDPG